MSRVAGHSMTPESGRSAMLRILVTRCVVALASLLLLGTVIIGMVPDDLPGLIGHPGLAPTVRPQPAPDLAVSERDVTLSRSLVEGLPFTATVDLQNQGDAVAERVQVLFAIVRASTAGEQNIVVVGATAGPVPAHAAIAVPVVIAPVVALVPGQYRYHASASIVRGQLDRDLRNNVAPVGLFAIEPPAACDTAADLAITPSDVVTHGQTVTITVHNKGPRTVYNVQVSVRPVPDVFHSAHVYHIARLLPCDGTGTVTAFRAGDTLSVEVNPAGGDNVSPETNHLNNSVVVRTMP